MAQFLDKERFFEFVIVCSVFIEFDFRHCELPG